VGRIIKIVIIGGILVLMWAAMDDITTGNEPDLIGEWVVVFCGTVLLLFMIWWEYMKKGTRREALGTRG
jgi:uncharacterized membrane protein YdcZ (DUF606 family)